MLESNRGLRMGGCLFCGKATCVAGSCRDMGRPNDLLVLLRASLLHRKGVVPAEAVTRWQGLSDAEKLAWAHGALEREAAQAERIRLLEQQVQTLLGAVETSCSQCPEDLRLTAQAIRQTLVDLDGFNQSLQSSA